MEVQQQFAVKAGPVRSDGAVGEIGPPSPDCAGILQERLELRCEDGVAVIDRILRITAVQSIRTWLDRIGRPRSTSIRGLMITVDCGGHLIRDAQLGMATGGSLFALLRRSSARSRLNAISKS